MEEQNHETMDVLGRIESPLAGWGWTLYRLARASGRPQSTLRKLWRRGNMRSIAMVKMICRPLGISLPYFFFLPKAQVRAGGASAGAGRTPDLP